MSRQRSSIFLEDAKCPIPGCTDRPLKGELVCTPHAVKIWARVQSIKGDPLIQNAITESVAEREQRMDEDERRRLEVSKTKGDIYYVRVDEKIKIGWSSNLGQRLASYPPHTVQLCDHPGTRADERDLHRTFKPSRASGREWYHPTPELMAHIDRVRNAEMERRSAAHWARVEQEHGTEHMLRVKAWSERQR